VLVLYTDEYFTRRSNKHQSMFNAYADCLKLNNLTIII